MQDVFDPILVNRLTKNGLSLGDARNVVEASKSYMPQIACSSRDDEETGHSKDNRKYLCVDILANFQWVYEHKSELYIVLLRRRVFRRGRGAGSTKNVKLCKLNDYTIKENASVLYYCYRDNEGLGRYFYSPLSPDEMTGGDMVLCANDNFDRAYHPEALKERRTVTTLGYIDNTLTYFPAGNIMPLASGNKYMAKELLPDDNGKKKLYEVNKTGETRSIHPVCYVRLDSLLPCGHDSWEQALQRYYRGIPIRPCFRYPYDYDYLMNRLIYDIRSHSNFRRYIVEGGPEFESKNGNVYKIGKVFYIQLFKGYPGLDNATSNAYKCAINNRIRV